MTSPRPVAAGYLRNQAAPTHLRLWHPDVAGAIAALPETERDCPHLDIPVTDWDRGPT